MLRPASPITEIEVLNPDIPKDAFEDKGIVLDIRVRMKDGSQIDVEMQVRRRFAFRKRLLFYWSKTYGTQIVRGEDYGKLRPAVLIVFLDYRELDAPTDRLHSIFRLLEVHDHQLFSKDMEIHLIELPKLSEMTQNDRAKQAELVRWSEFFTAKSDAALADAVEGDETMEKAKSYLELLSAKPDVRRLAEERERAQATYLIEMTAAREEGEARGREAGEIVGEARGRLGLLLEMVEQKFGPLSSLQRQLLEKADHDAVLKRLFTAESFDDLLDS